MSAGVQRDGAKLLSHLLDELDPTPEGHVAGLAANALRALAAGDPRASWFLADRLVRLTSGSDAHALMIRAAALAALGDADAARLDADAAAQAEPDHPLVIRSRLAGADAGLREQALRSLLRQAGDGDLAGVGAKVLAAGFTGLARLACEGDTIVGTMVWSGPDAVRIRSSDGRSHMVSVVSARHGLDPAPFAHAASFVLPVPDGIDALEVEVEGLDVLVEPRIVRPDRIGLVPSAPVAFENDREPMATSGLMIVVPVYDAVEAVAACFESLRSAPATSLEARIVAIDDAAPTPGVSALLDALAQDGRLTLLRNPLNLGFAGSVNRALALRRAGEDVLLLNADTIVPPGAIDRLAAAIRSDAAIGTVTPLSNNGEDTSLPRRFFANPMPGAHDVAALDALASAVNRDVYVDMPNGVGFCLYVGSAVLDRIGPLSRAFGRGYYEDVEFCLRASASGFRNVCATNVYVGHHGSLSFKGEKRALVRRNLSRLSQSHPDYRKRARDFERADPLRGPIGRLEEAWLAAGPAVDLLLTPPLPPALQKHLAEGLSGPDRRMVVATIMAAPGGYAVSLSAPDGGFPQNIVRTVPTGQAGDAIAACLQAIAPRAVFAVDPHELPAALVAALGDRGWLDHVVLARCPASLAGWTNVPPLARVVVPTGLMARRVAEAFPAAALRSLDVPPRACPPHRATQRLLLVETASDDEDGRARLEAVLRTQREGGLDYGVCLLGEPQDALRLMAEGMAFATGAMPADDLDAWLARSQATALFLNTAGFGLSDPRLGAWLAAGLNIAILGPGASGRPAGSLLELDPALPPDATAKALWNWVLSLQVAGAGAAGL